MFSYYRGKAELLEISLLPNLHYLRLDLNHCNEIYAMLKLVGENRLLSLYLADCTQFTGEEEGISDLKANLEHLETLCLVRCPKLTNKGFAKLLINAGSRLKKLQLDWTRLNDLMVAELVPSQYALQDLQLRGCPKLSNQGLLGLLNTLGRNLLNLDLSVSNISGEGFVESGIKLESLQILNLANCSSLTDQGLSELVNITGGHLKELLLPGNRTIVGQGLAVSDLPLKRLQVLDLSFCDKVTNQWMWEILDVTGQTLSTLILSGTKIIGEGFAALNLRMDKMQVLKLNHCPILTNQGLLEMINCMGSNLKELHLDGTNITGEGFVANDLRLDSLQILSLIGCDQLADSDWLRETLNRTNVEIIKGFSISSCLNLEEPT